MGVSSPSQICHSFSSSCHSLANKICERKRGSENEFLRVRTGRGSFRQPIPDSFSRLSSAELVKRLPPSGKISTPLHGPVLAKSQKRLKLASSFPPSPAAASDIWVWNNRDPRACSLRLSQLSALSESQLARGLSAGRIKSRLLSSTALFVVLTPRKKRLRCKWTVTSACCFVVRLRRNITALFRRRKKKSEEVQCLKFWVGDYHKVVAKEKKEGVISCSPLFQWQQTKPASDKEALPLGDKLELVCWKKKTEDIFADPVWIIGRKLRLAQISVQV